jgi:hypothetical protein
MRRNIVTFAEPQPNDNALFLLAEKLTGVNQRLAFVESEQALTISELITKIDQVLILLNGGQLPTLLNTTITSTLSITAVAGAPASFELLTNTADEQDARLDQLEAA